MELVIGIDGGATKSEAIVADLKGKDLERISGGPANPYLAGYKEVAKTIDALVATLFNKTGSKREDVKGLCVGLAGIDSPDDSEAMQQQLQKLFAEATVVAVNDSVIALIGGCLKYYGIIVISGTGSNTFGRNKKAEEQRAGGWGHVLGDEGSGYAIALKGLRAVARSADGRSPETILTQLVLKHLGLESPLELMRWTREISGDKATVSGLAPLVFDANKQGDAVAARILHEESEELALAAETVRRKLFSPSDKEFEVVVGGSNLLLNPEFREMFEHRVHAYMPGIKVILPKKEPAVGAKMLILKKLGY